MDSDSICCVCSGSNLGYSCMHAEIISYYCSNCFMNHFAEGRHETHKIQIIKVQKQDEEGSQKQREFNALYGAVRNFKCRHAR